MSITLDCCEQVGDEGELQMEAIRAEFGPKGLEVHVIGLATADEAKLVQLADIGGGKYYMAQQGMLCTLSRLFWGEGAG
jgi:hypothetical protein